MHAPRRMDRSLALPSSPDTYACMTIHTYVNTLNLIYILLTNKSLKFTLSPTLPRPYLIHHVWAFALIIYVETY